MVCVYWANPSEPTISHPVVLLSCRSLRSAAAPAGYPIDAVALVVVGPGGAAGRLPRPRTPRREAEEEVVRGLHILFHPGHTHLA